MDDAHPSARLIHSGGNDPGWEVRIFDARFISKHASSVKSTGIIFLITIKNILNFCSLYYMSGG